MGSTLTLESLIMIIASFIIFVVLIGVLVSLLRAVDQEQKTIEDKNFERIAVELNSLVKERYTGKRSTTVVFQQMKEGFMVAVYPKGYGPSQCKGESCICMHIEGKITCEIYKGIKKCDEGKTCGNTCFNLSTNKITNEKNALTIKQECNEVLFV